MTPAPSATSIQKDTEPNSTQNVFGFPKQDGYTLSHWLQEVQGNPLLNHLTTPELPQSADVVIIGSGMTGTLVAKHYIETWPEKTVVVLEAREFCSGATGRNAGHCKPDQWRGFDRYEKAFGAEQALKILENEHQTWSDLVAYVTPPEDFAGYNGLQNSFGVLLPNGGLFSINPRSTTGGPILFGGHNPGQHELERWLQKNPERRTDDGLAGFEAVTEAVQEFAESQFLGWPAAPTNHPEIYSDRWSGIIALSADGVPFIGELPGLAGQWVCAGHHGQLIIWRFRYYSGMARIFTAAPGLVKLMGGGSWADTRLPEVYQITPSRIKRLHDDYSEESSGLTRL
ncbi:hypothetical protein G7Z17_g682 [Cylindrodendrum hubeiense]|uniref:FAD dependent oxidoreductase domain-containing protein n=1 Tax=Cylindrodendrum hubeiense TaxID=595255 RepID=A0A9P5HMT6_9HYPO|nr:hypothetical protein G7Z17_g682 [Cylindrodendrum hubeiense]